MPGTNDRPRAGSEHTDEAARAGVGRTLMGAFAKQLRGEAEADGPAGFGQESLPIRCAQAGRGCGCAPP